MRNPYAPAFWCVLTALCLLTGTCFLGLMRGQSMGQALMFLDSASVLLGALAICAIAWCMYLGNHLKKRQLTEGHILVTIWDTKVALRRVESVFERFFWGNHCLPGRSFHEVLGELNETPLEHCLEALKLQCRNLDQELHSEGWNWLNLARELTGLANAMARERCELELFDRHPQLEEATVVDHDLELLVRTWTNRLRTFDSQLDELEGRYL